MSALWRVILAALAGVALYSYGAGLHWLGSEVFGWSEIAASMSAVIVTAVTSVLSIAVYMERRR